MFTSNNNDVLEEFRIKAHLRSYVKDPIMVNENLLQAAIVKLKKLPYDEADPSGAIAKKLVRNAIKSGYYNKADLTELGCTLLKPKKSNKRKHKKARRHFIMINQHSSLTAV